MTTERDQEHAYFLKVLTRLTSEFIDLRVEHFCRVKPEWRGHLDDLTFQIKLQMEHIFRDRRTFGGVRVANLDIMIGDSEDRRKAIMNATDQNTLITDLIDKAEEASTTAGGGSVVNDVRSLYDNLDPRLGKMVQVFQGFLWLDLFDIIYAANAEISLSYIMEVLKQKTIPPNIKASVNRQLNRAEDRDLALEEALLLHYHRIKNSLSSLATRRKIEKPYELLIRRESSAAAGETANQALMAAAQSNHRLQQLEGQAEISDQIRQHYATTMKIAPEQVTREAALASERKIFAEARHALAKALGKTSAYGAPVNHKMEMLRGLSTHFEKVVGALKQAGVDLEKAPPVANPEAE